MESQPLRSQIRLNFLALQSQGFSFAVYRRRCSTPDEAKPSDDIHKFSFPADGDEETRPYYWVCFEPRKGHEEYTAGPETNRPMAIRFLSFALSEHVMADLPEGTFDLEGMTFRHGVDIIMANHAKGTERIWIEPIYLAPVSKFGFLVDFHFRKSPNVTFDKEVQRLSLSLNSQGLSNKNFYSDKYRKLQEFRGKFGEQVFSATFRDGLLAVQPNLESVDANTLNPRKFVFDGNRDHPVPFTGLARFGPLTPLNRPLRFALVYGKSDRPHVNELAAGLMGRSREVPFRGLAEVFKVVIGGSLILESDTLTVQSITKSVARLTEERSKDPGSILLPLVVMTNKDPQLYRSVKYELLKAGFPAQVVSTEKIGDRGTFKWAVADIALQMFAKAGGEPWRVVPSTEHCVIFGIGQAHEEDDAGNVKRFFSYLVCTDTTGLYRRSDVLGASDNEETYLTQLRERILGVMKEELGGGYTRCVLHVPFRIRHAELEAIESAIGELHREQENAKTQFVVLRINTESKYFGYADTTSLIPYESTYVRVSNSPRTYLVWFEGLLPNDPVVRQRPSGPVQIEFHWPKRDLTEPEERQLLQDVLNLAGCNWRGFNAKHLPISIFYCQLVAKHLRRFGDIDLKLADLPGPWFL